MCIEIWQKRKGIYMTDRNVTVLFKTSLWEIPSTCFSSWHSCFLTAVIICLIILFVIHVWRDNIKQKWFCEQIYFPKCLCLLLQVCRKIRAFQLNICLQEKFWKHPVTSAGFLHKNDTAVPQMITLIFFSGLTLPFKCGSEIKFLIKFKAGQLGITIS